MTPAAACAVFGGAEQPAKEAERAVDVAAVAPVFGDQQPRQGQVFVLTQVERSVVRTELTVVGPLPREGELVAADP